MNNRFHFIVWIIFLTLPIFVFLYTDNWENAFVTFMVELFFYCVYGLFWLHWNMKRQEDAEIWIINKMTDAELEDFTKQLLEGLGFKITKPSNVNPDISFLLTTTTGKKAIVKVKSHKRDIGIRLVQRTHKQMDMYDASECWVITNQRYTSAATEFAEKHNICLYDREQFIKWILKAKKKEEVSN